MKAPKKIWLQHEDREHPDCDNYFGDGMTWCEDKINDDDVEYIRKDEVKKSVRQAIELAAERGATKANELFAERASERGRAMLPTIVRKDMKQSILDVMDEIE